jgi:hypothetical protein
MRKKWKPIVALVALSLVLLSGCGSRTSIEREVQSADGGEPKYVAVQLSRASGFRLLQSTDPTAFEVVSNSDWGYPVVDCTQPYARCTVYMLDGGGGEGINPLLEDYPFYDVDGGPETVEYPTSVPNVFIRCEICNVDPNPEIAKDPGPLIEALDQIVVSEP